MRTLTFLAIMLIAASAFAMDMRTGTQSMVDWPSDRDAYSCDSEIFDSGFYQDMIIYGNAFDVGAGGMLTTVEFWHYAWGEVAGPYDYTLFVMDEATCAVLCQFDLQAADSMNDHVLEVVDLSAEGCMVSGNIVVGVLPLTVSPYGYYHPTLDFEYSPLDGCMRQVVDFVGCDTPLDNGDFLLRITVETTTATDGVSFSTVKAIY